MSQQTGRECYGPFPFACGVFLVVGSGVVRQLLSSGAYHADFERLWRLPKTQPLLVEDAWLGSAIWRFLPRIQLQLFTFLGDRLLYVDALHGMLIKRPLMVWHNRFKFTHRIDLLQMFADRHHCQSDLVWKRIANPPYCCNPRRNNASIGPSGGPRWPIYVPNYRWRPDTDHQQAAPNPSATCYQAEAVELIDLHNASEHIRLGLPLQRIAQLSPSQREVRTRTKPAETG